MCAWRPRQPGRKQCEVHLEPCIFGEAKHSFTASTVWPLLVSRATSSYTLCFTPNTTTGQPAAGAGGTAGAGSRDVSSLEPLPILWWHIHQVRAAALLTCRNAALISASQRCHSRCAAASLCYWLQYCCCCYCWATSHLQPNLQAGAAVAEHVPGAGPRQ